MTAPEPQLPVDTRPQRPPTPTWVKALGLALAAVLVALVVAFLIGGVEHGPGRHG